MSKAAAPPGKMLRHPAILRLIHWTHTAVTLLLALTGFYLGRPFLPPHLLRVAHVRLTHLTFATPFIATALLHLVYSLVSGSWHDLLPDRRDWRTAGCLLRYELLLAGEAPMHGKYHLLQKLLYLSFLPAVLIQGATGWALASHSTWSGSLFIRLAGDLQRVRLIHHFVALYLIATVTLHFYRVLSEPGMLVAMVTGWAAAVPPAGTPEEKATRPPHLR
ncbi:MAG: cytochrome b/b6 domain-containing protein [Bacillota bacterium]|nr:cytochrome b/b6 domain-containing protein [Bacillota bacterium]